MVIKRLFLSNSIDAGISFRHDSSTKFKITRKKDPHGIYFYHLENISRHEKIQIPNFLLERVRATIEEITNRNDTIEPIEPIEQPIYFKDKCHYKITTDKNDLKKIFIMDEEPEKGSTGFISFNRDGLTTLTKLLFDKKLEHPNDTLSRIIAYHKLFQFSFSDASESITSDLVLKHGILSEVENFTPALGMALDKNEKVETVHSKKNTTRPPSGDIKSSPKATIFQSHLAEKKRVDEHRVDYEKLFSSNEGHGQKFREKLRESLAKNEKVEKRNQFFAPILADTIKKYAPVPFKCEYTTDEINELRTSFLGDRHAEYFLGIEICDCLFRRNRQLKTFRFPLYYMKVNIKESGRFIYIEPRDDNTLFLNHMALANIIENFGQHQNGTNNVDTFFKTLRAQQIEISGSFDRIYLARHLPYNLDVFDKTRDLLLGPPHENGMGGLLSILKIIGIECDLDSVFLYKTPKINTPTSKASEYDLDQLLEQAYSTPDKFYRSLLGQFLSPSTKRKYKNKEPFCETSLSPGHPTPSYKKLVDKLNRDNILLLEGPPGTGKTFSIMNLLIHAINEKKKILIVSDKEGALHALNEKVEEYLVGKDFESNSSKHLIFLWRHARKLIDQVAAQDKPLSQFASDLKAQLCLDLSDKISNDPSINYKDEINCIDNEIKQLTNKIDDIMLLRLNNLDSNESVSPKKLHATTIQDINELIAFLQFIGPTNPDNIKLVSNFINDRKFLSKEAPELARDLLNIDSEKPTVKLEEALNSLLAIIKAKPKNRERLTNALSLCKNETLRIYLDKTWHKHFGIKSKIQNSLVKLGSLFRYPLLRKLNRISRVIKNQLAFIKLESKLPKAVWKELKIIHHALTDGGNNKIPLTLELCQFATKDNADSSISSNELIQDLLEKIDSLQEKRDQSIKLLFIQNLKEIITSLFISSSSSSGRKTSPLTTISATLDGLKECQTLDDGTALWHDLQNSLYQTFPIWLCRKQNVSFLFPCHEQLFDLIIVDEATQCRVDDALPLLYRAKKFLVVGDEKQTVLAKDSVVDDYLFSEFDLDEHLRTTQARGLKGGGSNIFSLIKGIKESSVMLDEHYRCPPEIIEFSNKYVYNNELRTMKWNVNSNRTVTVSNAEFAASSSVRIDKGQFKGIETEMIDRFFEYIESEIIKIEKERGRKINVTTDVAICYFLLKNRPYIEKIANNHLSKWQRGDQILHGAGAALQGKERDYIFYLWDINRGNMMAFKQGDEPDKRKGELNVLMSRPKERSFHYLHKNFAELDHHKSTITDYLWKKYHSSKLMDEKKFIERKTKPTSDFTPWRRYSGQLIEALLEKLISDKDKKQFISYKKSYSVIVGDPNYRVDLIISNKDKHLGVVDLAGFNIERENGDDVVDYYFQLKRAAPEITPIFIFIHELTLKNLEIVPRIIKLIKY